MTSTTLRWRSIKIRTVQFIMNCVRLQRRLGLKRLGRRRVERWARICTFPTDRSVAANFRQRKYGCSILQLCP